MNSSGTPSVTSQGRKLVSASTTDKYYDVEFPISFPNKLVCVIPVDTISGTSVTSATTTPGLLWASSVSSTSEARLVSDMSFNSTGVGWFSCVAVGY